MLGQKYAAATLPKSFLYMSTNNVESQSRMDQTVSLRPATRRTELMFDSTVCFLWRTSSMLVVWDTQMSKFTSRRKKIEYEVQRYRRYVRTCTMIVLYGPYGTSSTYYGTYNHSLQKIKSTIVRRVLRSRYRTVVQRRYFTVL